MEDIEEMTTDERKAVEPLAEIAAMREVAGTFEKLSGDEAAIVRVLRWANDRYGRTTAAARGSSGGSGGTTGVGEALVGGGAGNAVEDIRQRYADLADFSAAASPTTTSDRALIAGYWHQFIRGEVEFTGFTINSALRHLGYPASNITVAFERLQTQRPALVVQIRKSGTSKQARKKYKLTNEGKRAVEAMIAQAT